MKERGEGWLELIEAGRVHRLRVREQAGAQNDWERAGLWRWGVQLSGEVGWELAALGTAEECLQRGATVATGEDGWSERPGTAYWPGSKAGWGCELERKGGGHLVLAEALRRRGPEAATVIQEVATVVRRRTARGGGGAQRGVGQAVWAGVMTGLGVESGVQSVALRPEGGAATAGGGGSRTWTSLWCGGARSTWCRSAPGSRWLAVLAGATGRARCTSVGQASARGRTWCTSWLESSA